MVKLLYGHLKMVKIDIDQRISLFDDRFILGAVVHKLLRHRTTIVSVSFTANGNIAITGKENIQSTFICYLSDVF
jgi:hypothetical protein